MSEPKLITVADLDRRLRAVERVCRNLCDQSPTYVEGVREIGQTKTVQEAAAAPVPTYASGERPIIGDVVKCFGVEHVVQWLHDENTVVVSDGSGGRRVNNCFLVRRAEPPASEPKSLGQIDLEACVAALYEEPYGEWTRWENVTERCRQAHEAAAQAVVAAHEARQSPSWTDQQLEAANVRIADLEEQLAAARGERENGADWYSVDEAERLIAEANSIDVLSPAWLAFHLNCAFKKGAHIGRAEGELAEQRKPQWSAMKLDPAQVAEWKRLDEIAGRVACHAATLDEGAVLARAWLARKQSGRPPEAQRPIAPYIAELQVRLGKVAGFLRRHGDSVPESTATLNDAADVLERLSRE